MSSRLSAMRDGRTLGTVVGAVALLDLVSMATRPVAEGRASAAVIALTAVLLAAHALLYVFVQPVIARAGRATYLAGQSAVLFGFGLLNPPLALAIVLYVAAAVHAATLVTPDVSVTRVFLVLIAFTALSTGLASNVYRGATVALILAAAGLAVGIAAQVGAEPRVVAVASPVDVAPPPVDECLTPRELEVLRLAAAGATSKRVAADLAITERTVKAHLSSAYLKLGAKTRAEAVAIASRRGMIE